MIRKVLLLFSCYFLASIIIVSCSDCAGESDYLFNLIDAELKPLEYSLQNSSQTCFEQNDLTSDSIAFDLFGFELQFIMETYRASVNTGYSAFNSLYACDPNLSNANQMISVKIYCDKKIHMDFEANEDISELFEVATYYRSPGKCLEFNYTSLQQYFETEAALNPVYTRLKEQPIESGTYQFFIEYVQDYANVNTIEASTGPVIIKI